MTENPYFDNIVSKAVRENWKWQDRAEELADSDDVDLTEEEVEEVAEEMYRKIKDSCYHTEEFADTLPRLLSRLADLSAEWRTMSNQLSREDGKDRIRESFYSEMSIVAQDEVERLEYIMEEYL